MGRGAVRPLRRRRRRCHSTRPMHTRVIMSCRIYRSGVASMIGTLLTGPSIRRLGPRGHTVAATGASASASLILGRATSDAVAFGGVVPMALGSGKGMATSARITNLGEELGVPQVIRRRYALRLRRH